MNFIEYQWLVLVGNLLVLRFGILVQFIDQLISSLILTPNACKETKQKGIDVVPAIGVPINKFVIALKRKRVSCLYRIELSVHNTQDFKSFFLK